MNSASYITFMKQFDSGLYTEITAKKIATNIYISQMITDEEYETLMEKAKELHVNTEEGVLISRIVSLEEETRVLKTEAAALRKAVESGSAEVENPDPGPNGSVDNPITAIRGMVYYKDKHYIDPDDGQTYLCIRDNDVDPGSGVALAYLPHELVGIYFQVKE